MSPLFRSRREWRARRIALVFAYAALLGSCESPLGPDVAEVGHVEVQPQVLNLTAGQTAPLTGRVFDLKNGEMVARIYWSSQNEAVATVDQNGVVTAVGPGATQIAGSSGGRSAFSAVTVTARPVALIRLTPPSTDVVAGATLQLGIEVLDASGGPIIGRVASWSSSNPAAATVNGTGLVSGVAPGLTTIRASIDDVEGTSVITVRPVPVATITVSPPNATIEIGQTRTYVATARDAAGAPLAGRTIVWSSSNDAVAAVSQSGVATGVSEGSATLTASSPGNGPGGTTPTGNATITVNLVPVARVQIVPGTVSIAQGDLTSFTANLFAANDAPLTAAGRTITWSSSDPAVATINPTTGLASGVTVGTTTITASVSTPGQTGTVEGTATLTISNVPVASVVVTPNPGVVHLGALYARQFSAAVLDAQGAPLSRAVVWTSTNQAVAVVDPSTGMVTGVALGTAQIRATAEGIQGAASVTVDLVGIASVDVTPSSANLTPPQAVQLNATARDSAGNDVTGQSLGFRPTFWTTDAPSVATVDGSGLVASVAQGSATITAAVGGASGTSVITVGAVPVATITVTPNPQSIFVGESLQLTATALDANNQPLTGRPFSWSSPSPSIVTVNGSGLITGVSIGGPVLVAAATGGKVGTSSITVVPRPAVKLGIATQPSAAAQSGVPLGQQPAIQLLDALDAPVAQAGVVVTAAIASGGGTVSGTVTATTNAAGLATFSSLAINGPAGAYTLGFSAPSLTGVSSSTVVLGAGGPSKVAIITQPSVTAQSGIVLSQQPVAQLRDASDNPVAQSGIAITVSLTGGAGTLSGTLTVPTDANGVASFGGLAISALAPGPYTLTFSAAGLASATSAAITLSAGVATQLAIATQPSATAINGSVLSQQPAVRLRDAAGNDVAAAGVVVTAALTSGGATLGGSLTATTGANGIATFSSLVITGTAGTYGIQFTAPSLSSITSAGITLGAGAPTKLSITTQPSTTATNDVNFAQQPSVQLQDASGNSVSSSGVVVSVAIASGGGTLGGTLTASTNAAGLASFTNLRITGTIGSRTLAFTSGALTSATSNAINVVAGAATQLSMTTAPPATATSGQALVPAPVLQLLDVSGNSVAQAGVAVTAAIATGTGASLSNATVTTSGSGAATFNALTLTGSTGSYTLTFSSGALTPATSGTIALSAGTGSKLTMTTQPSASAINDAAFAQQPAIQLRDASDNPVQQSGVVVTAAIASGAPALGGTTTATTDASGVATFSGLKITGVTGSRTLIFAASGYVSVTSNTIDVTTGPAAQLSLSTQPPASVASGAVLAPQPVVFVGDVSNNPVAGTAVTAAISSGGGTLLGTLIATSDAAGHAAFIDLAVSGTSGARTLSFTAGALSVTSNTMMVTAGAPATIALTTPPSSSAASGAVFAQQPVVEVKDGSGNGVSGAVVTAAIATGAGTLGGTTTATTNASGVAAFTDLMITGVVGDRTLSFSAASLTPALSGTITITPGPASALSITQQPSATVINDVAFSQQPLIQVNDASGNPVGGVTVTASIASGGGTLGGTLAATSNGSGVATFVDLRITGTTGARTLSFSVPTPASVTSSAVTVNAGPATHLSIATPPPGSAQSGSVFAQAPVIFAGDVSNNAVGGVSITAAIATGGGTLGGTPTVATGGSGTAAFTDLSITGSVGDRTLNFTATGLSPVTSGTITITAGAPTSIAIITQPSATTPNDVAFAQQPSVQLNDASGNAVGGAVVSAAIAGGGGVLGGTTTATSNASGVATFTDLRITGTVGVRTLTFSVPTPASVTSNAIDVTAGSASQVSISTPPSASAVTGAPFPQQPVILVGDVSNNAVPGVIVSAAIATGAGTLGGTLTATSNASGLAAFTDLMITGTTGPRTLSFSATGAGSVTSGTINITAGAPAVIAITTQPSASAQNDAAFAQQPVIQVNDGSGNGVGGVIVTATIASGGGTLGGSTTATTDASGAATFTNLKITGVTGDRTLSFDAASLTPVASGTITVTAGAPASLSVSTQPSPVVQNAVAFPQQPVIQVNDISGNAVSGAVVTASIATGAGTLGGTLTATSNGSGVATFTDLTITGATGDRTLGFSVPAPASTTSNTVSVTAGAATKLGITTQPSASAQNGAVFGTQPVVQVQDVSGNAVSQSGVVVTAAIASGSGTLGGTTDAATDASGVATFTDLLITGTAGPHTLTFTATGLAAATSASIALTAGPASQLSITTQPSASATSGVAFAQQPVIQLRDASGNAVSQSGVVVIAALTGGGGAASLGGTLAISTNASGVAPFTNLAITGPAGNYTLDFTATSLTGVTSATITLAAAAVASVSVTSQGDSLIGNPPGTLPVTVTVRDAANQVLSGKSVSISSSNTGAATVSPTSATTDSNGEVAVTATYVAAGSTTITATSQSINGTQTLRMLAPVNAVTFAPGSRNVNTSNPTRTFTITVTNASAVALPGRVCSFSAKNSLGNPTTAITLSPTSASTNGSGQITLTVTAVTPISTTEMLTVTGTCETKSGTGTVNISP